MPRRPKTPDVTEPLFSEGSAADAPLAARMRPRTLEKFMGQPHLVGDEGALTRVVKPGHLPSMVLWGPPGSGKTTTLLTLARDLLDRADWDDQHPIPVIFNLSSWSQLLSAKSR